MDDPLSAVDINVGLAIFENYIQRQLRNKTVVLVTHQIQYLNQCDEVYVMKDGAVAERGTHEELLNLDKEYATMVKAYESVPVRSSGEIKQSLTDRQEICPVTAKNQAETRKNDKGPVKHDAGENLTVDEPSNSGNLKADTYFTYINAAGGYMIAALVFSVFLANAGSTAFSSWWLATWINAGGGVSLISCKM